MKKIYLILLITITGFIQAQCPTPTVTPLTRTLTCNGAAQTFTAMHTPSSNIGGRWYNPGYSVTYTSSAGTNILYANSPGIYIYEVFDYSFACSSTQTVLVVASPSIPTMTITAGFPTVAITCNQPCIPFSISSTSSLAPLTYTWTNLATSVPAFPANSGYTVCAPGMYEAQFKDGNNCLVSQTISVPINTFVGTPVSPNNYTFCSTPTVMINANTTLSAPSTYTWTGPVGSTISSPSSYSTAVDFGGTYTVAIKGAFNGCTIYNTASVTVCTGLNNLNNNEFVSLFPNPNNGQFILKIDKEIQDGEIVIFNYIGQEIYKQRINKGINTIKLDNLASGIYYYTVFNKNESLLKSRMTVD